MRRYVIERDMPGAGQLTDDQICAASATSNKALRDLCGRVQWVHSYVTDDRIYCIYLAENEQLVREHAVMAGLPATIVNEVRRIIDPLSEKTKNAT